MKKYLIMLIALLMLAPMPASANITLDKVVVTFAQDSKPVTNVMVTNSGDKPLKINAEVVKTSYSGTDKEAEEPTKELILAPKSFELEPGASRKVRLVLRQKPTDMEAIYRARFKPDTPAFTKEQSSGGTSVKVGVVVSMGVLVMAAPVNPQPNLQFERKRDTIVFTNKGNVTAQLQREDFCNEDRSLCVPLTGKRVYPGSVWEMKIPKELIGKEFKQTLLVNEEYSTLTYTLN